MRELLEVVKKWSPSEKIAVARVIKTWGSSPRPAGSIMLVNQEGKMAGSVSGGCVEGAVVKSARKVLENNEAKILNFGVSDEDAWSVGLSCGGSIEVLLESVDLSGQIWSHLLGNLEENRSSILISSLEDGNNSNTLIEEDGNILGDNIPKPVLVEGQKAYSQRVHRTVKESGTSYFIQIFPRKPQLLIIGAAHITVDLVSLGNLFGFETIVIDPRGYFATNTVFADPPSRILEAYPSEVLHDFILDAHTFCAVLSHDPKIDDDALEILLASNIGYIGALGSKKTHIKRTNRLLEKGISQQLIDKIHAPIGMNIHAKSAREIALSIIGEIVGIKNEYL